MCGIAGWIARRGTKPDEAILWRMADAIRRRGPDDSGTLVQGEVGFAFRRLAILDLTPAGHQPMVADDGSASIVFNGEIYNYLELRADLLKRGYRFHGNSDTEVVLRLYQEFGADMLARLNGMFALAIHDRRRERVLLARDRFGKKPLFCWRGPHGLAFASELKALRVLPGFPTDPDPGALALYWRIGLIPSWTCVHRQVIKVPPSSWMEYDLRAESLSEPNRYWELPAPGEDSNLTESTILEELEGLLADATRIRLRSDVPVGVFLSGGIDSGLVASYAASELPSIRALTIAVPRWDEDESKLAAETASKLGIQSIVRNIDVRDGLTLLPRLMAHYDEPFSDSSSLPTHLVCAEARKSFTVVLSGDGGDEGFAGYDNHVRAARWSWLEHIPPWLREGVSRAVLGCSAHDSRARRFAKRLARPIGNTGLGAKISPVGDWMNSYLDPAFRIDERACVADLNKRFDARTASSPVDLAQRTDLRLYMLDDILVKVDRMSMYNSLEVRSPLLDFRLIELGLRIPTRLRIAGGRNKAILRALAARRLPASVVNAPKRGFAIPFRKWLKDSATAPQLKEALICPGRGTWDCFVPGGAERLWNDAQTNPALVAPVFHALAYRWWSAGAISGH